MPLPDARRVTMSLRDEHMEVGRRMLAASRKCWTRRPEGPAAVPFGNERMQSSQNVEIRLNGYGSCTA